MKRHAALALVFLIFTVSLAGCIRMAGPPVAALLEKDGAMPVAKHAGDTPAGRMAFEFYTPTPAPSPAPSPVPAKTPQADASFSELAPTTRMSFEELVGDNADYEAVKGYPAPGTFKLVVDLYHQVVMAYKKDKTGAYTVPVRYMVCSSGSSKHPSPRGTYETGKHRVRFGLFVNDGVYGQYWSQITRRIYFHSLLYSSKNAKAYTTTSYKNLGKRASHGCIRLLVPDARWIYYHIAPGTEVELRRGDKNDTQTAAIKEQLTRPALPKQRPNLKPGEIPYTDNWDIKTYLSNYNDVVYVKI